MATFTNVTKADLYVKDEYGRMVKFLPGQTKAGQSDFLYNYTSQAVGQRNKSGGSTSAAPEPLLASAGTAPTNMPGPNINPNNVITSGRLDREAARAQLSVQLVDGAPAASDDTGLYSNGTSVWVVAGGAVITVS